MTRILVIFLAGMLISANLYSQSAIGLNTYQISKLTGVRGQINSKEDIYKVFQSREDLEISMTGMKVMPAMGLVSWVAFKKEADETIIQGNLVLTEDQISPIMDIALNNGLRITSLENHYLWESPKVMFMHIEGSGKELALAQTVGKIFKEIKKTSYGNGNFPLAMLDVEKTTLNPHKIDAILHTQGVLKNGVYKVMLNKDNPFSDPDMGISTWASFTGSDKEALVIGDIVTKQAALNKVLFALHHAGFYIVAIHPQLSSQMVYLHYLGIGNSQTLAKGIHTALSIPVPFGTENKNGLNIYPIISYPDESMHLPSLSPNSNNGNFILNLDISFFNKNKTGQPILENTNQISEKSTENMDNHANMNEAKS